MSIIGTLQIGSRVHYDGDICSVVAFQGLNVMLRDSRGGAQVVCTRQLLSSTGFELLDPSADADAAAKPTFFDALPTATQQRAQTLAEHIREARTGYRSETAEDDEAVEPNPLYDISLTGQMERWRNKVEELGKQSDPKLRLSERTLRQLAARYDSAGVWGLVDKRVVRTLNTPVDPDVLRAIRQAIDDNASKSNISKASYRKVVQARLTAVHGEDAPPLPARTRFEEILDQAAGGLGLFGQAKTKRSIRNRPDAPYKRILATRAGEVVEIDVARLDVFAVDPVTFDYVQVELAAAYDVYTHLAMARLTPYNVKGLDAALFLLDLIRPKPRGGAAQPYLGVPEVVVLGDGRAPALLPESVTIDNGKIFRSEVFENACRRFAINIRLARPYRPTDKPHVERFFRTIRHDVLELLPGYKGPNLYDRGAAIEKDAFYFTDEVDALVASYTDQVYNVRRQEGLFLPGRPGLPMSPVEMYEESAARTGQIRVPLHPTLYYELLPRAWRQINHYGVEIGGLIYDDQVLNDNRGSHSSFNGQQRGKWPFHVDPGDRSEVYFQNADGTWFPIPWVGARAAADPRPFAETTVAYAKKLLLRRGGKAKNHEELGFVINELLDRLDRQIAAESAEERRAYVREEVERRRRAKDRSRPTRRRAESADDEIVLSDSGKAANSPSDAGGAARNGVGNGIDLSQIKPMGVVGDNPGDRRPAEGTDNDPVESGDSHDPKEVSE